MWTTYLKIQLAHEVCWLNHKRIPCHHQTWPMQSMFDFWTCPLCWRCDQNESQAGEQRADTIQCSYSILRSSVLRAAHMMSMHKTLQASVNRAIKGKWNSFWDHNGQKFGCRQQSFWWQAASMLQLCKVFPTQTSCCIAGMPYASHRSFDLSATVILPQNKPRQIKPT